MQRRCQPLASSKRLILKVEMRNYSESCQNCQRHVDASLLKTSFVNTPQRNLTFSLINCRSMLSPSAPMAVRLRRSTISSRPWRSALAFSHAVANSAVHGAISLPSKTSRQRRGLSTTEILNMRISLGRLTAQDMCQRLERQLLKFSAQKQNQFLVLWSVNGVLTRIRRSRGDRCQTSSF